MGGSAKLRWTAGECQNQQRKMLLGAKTGGVLPPSRPQTFSGGLQGDLWVTVRGGEARPRLGPRRTILYPQVLARGHPLPVLQQSPCGVPDTGTRGCRTRAQAGKAGEDLGKHGRRTTEVLSASLQDAARARRTLERRGPETPPARPGPPLSSPGSPPPRTPARPPSRRHKARPPPHPRTTSATRPYASCASCPWRRRRGQQRVLPHRGRRPPALVLRPPRRGACGIAPEAGAETGSDPPAGAGASGSGGGTLRAASSKRGRGGGLRLRRWRRREASGGGGRGPVRSSRLSAAAPWTRPWAT